MTYKELKNILNAMNEESLNCDAVVYIPGINEHIPLTDFPISTNTNDVLDEGHPVLRTV